MSTGVVERNLCVQTGHPTVGIRGHSVETPGNPRCAGGSPHPFPANAGGQVPKAGGGRPPLLGASPGGPRCNNGGRGVHIYAVSPTWQPGNNNKQGALIPLIINILYI